jgi:hypothetical protein
MTRSRETELARHRCGTNKGMARRVRAKRCARRSLSHAQHTHMSDLPTRGTHESRRVRAQRSACRYHKKSVRIFFDTKFHDGTQAMESNTRP